MTRKKLLVSFFIGALVSGVALYFSFRNIPFGELIEYIAQVNYWWMLPAMGISLFTFVLRVVRWRIILSSTAKIGFWEAWHPTMIGFMMNCIFPARVGEFARPAILKKRNNVSFFGVLATVAAERVFDLIALLTFFVWLVKTVPIDPGFSMKFGDYVLNKETLTSIATGMAQLAGVLLVGMILVAFSRTRRILERIIMASPDVLFFLGAGARNKLRSTLCVRVVGIMERVALGFDAIKSPVKIAACLALSFLVWFLMGYLHVLVAKGFPGLDLSFSQLLAVMVIVCFFISLPSVPGFWGLWEAGGIFALMIFGVTNKAAAGYTLVNHVVQMLPAIAVGILSAVVTGVNIWRITTSQSPEDLAPEEALESCNKE